MKNPVGRCLALFSLTVFLSCGDDDGGGGAFLPAPAPAGPEMGSMRSGASEYVDGVFVWTDYAYDDRGPNEDAADGYDRNDSAFAGGDAEYPPEAAPGNAADLIQLQISLHRGAVALWAILQTLVDPALPVVGVAFDTDVDSSTGADSLPGGRWRTEGSLGVEVMIEISSAGGRLWTYDAGEWSAGELFESAVDTQTNTIGTTVPPDQLAAPRAVWRVAAAVGIATEAGNWLDDAADIYDIAFVGAEPAIRWQGTRQADVLAEALDVREAIAEVDFALLARGETTVHGTLPPGFHTFLYRSELTLGEGVEYDDSFSPIFLGPYQPYLVYIPDGMPSPTALSVFLHGSDQNHLGAVFQQPGDIYIGTGRALSEDPHLIEPLGFAGDGFDFPPHMLQVYPLARGARLGYRGIAHQDVLDVVADTMRRFDVDPDRVILQGASMGGIGTYRMGSLQPDLWSVALPLIGYQAADLMPLSANLLNLPVRQINGAADPLIPEPPATASAARLDELEYDYRYWLLEDRGHEAGGYVYDCVYAEAPDYVRVSNPARVVFSVDSSLDVVDPETGIDLRFNSAYWVSRIIARDPEQLANVDVESSALPRYEERIVHIDRMLDNIDHGADLCGENPEVQTGDRWHERAVEIERSAELPLADEIVLTLENVAAMTIDIARSAVDTASATIDAQSDGVAQLTLANLPEGTTVQAAGESRTANGTEPVTVSLGSGPNTIDLAR